MPKTTCGKKHIANKHICKAYGVHSPICTGAQTQYVLQCGSEQPQPLIKEQEISLGESSYSSGSSAAPVAKATEKVVVPPEQTLKEHMAPALLVCQVEVDRAKLQCKKAVTGAYTKFKAAEDANAGPSELAETRDGEEDTVETLYDEALQNMKGKTAEAFKELTIAPKHHLE